MAIDSALKRKSIAALALQFLVPGITPDATTPVAWRQTSAWSYPGIASVLTEQVRTLLAGQTWAKVQPVAQTWAKDQPDDQTWAKDQPDDQTWSVT